MTIDFHNHFYPKAYIDELSKDGGFDVAQGESLDVGEEDGPVSEVESLTTSAEPGVGVSEAPFIVVAASAAPGSEVCAVDACRLDEADGGEGLAS